MKKAIDQTVRELKREVNKKVLKVPGIEQKILDATSNEPWGPHGSLLADIAQATLNYHEYQMVMHIMWKRLNDTGKNWRHVYKALTVLEYLVGHGSERVIDEIREHAYQISTLADFQYIDSSGRDQGSNVRRKSQSLVALVNDKEKVQEVRQKAASNRDKFRSTFASAGSSYPGGGSYGDRYDNDRNEGRYRDSYEGRSKDSYDGRYRDSYDGRYKDDDRNGYGREKEWGSRDDDRYGKGSDSYNRDGDQYGRDSDDRYGRDSYRDDDYRGRRGDDYQYGPRSRSLDRDRDRSSEEDDRFSSRTNGGGVHDLSHDERLERKLSEHSPPPSYEEAVRDAHENIQDGRGPENVAPSAAKAQSTSVARESYPASASYELNQSTAGGPASALNKDDVEFDGFDPRGAVPAAPAPASGSGVDFFGNQSASDQINSLALVPVGFEADVPASSDGGNGFVALSSASPTFNQPNEDPFGDGPFKASTQSNVQAQQQVFPAASSFQSSGMSTSVQPPSQPAPKAETISTFDFGGPLGGLTYTPAVASGHQNFAASPPYTGSEFQGMPANNDAAGAPMGFVPPQSPQQFQYSPNMSPANFPPQAPQGAAFPPNTPPSHFPSQAPQPPQYSTNMPPAHVNYPPQSGSPAASARQPPVSPMGAANPQPASSSQPSTQMALTTTGQPANAQPIKDKFETKSTIWTDTLNRGLVNLNISGAKVNPLADIGVDFEAINRMEKRKEKPSAAPITSTTAMGKAMGSGSGIGRVGAGGLASSPNPMMGSGMGMGMGMGGGGGMGRGVGMGMGMGMGNAGMGMGGYSRGMNQPMGMGMNRGMAPGMNMGMNQGAQMRPPAQGPGMPGYGYNPTMGMGGYSSQQPYGGGYR